LTDNTQTPIDGGAFYYSLDSAVVAGAYQSGDVTINTDTVWNSTQVLSAEDFIVTKGKIIIGAAPTDTAYCSDAVFNNVGAGDSVIINSVLVVSGNFSCAGAVKFNTGAKIIMTACTQATLNGNSVVVTYPEGCSFGATSRRTRQSGALNTGLIIGTE
jgi:hypothetical protein